MTAKPLVLIILDGWGYREEKKHNPTRAVPTPTMDYLYQHYPHTLLEASGTAVGLPEGQMGNSEVGHLHIGGGRKVPQDLTRINLAVETGEFAKNPVFLKAVSMAKKQNKAIHVVGLLSPGGVHSQETHIAELFKMMDHAGLKKSFLHAILDGRDTPPKSAMASLKQLAPKIVSLIGRYYAMDRDKRWERTQMAYDLLTLGKAIVKTPDAMLGLELAYQRGEMDEFVKPTVIDNGQGNTRIENGDIVIFMNFRTDRLRQLVHAFSDKNFLSFPRGVVPNLTSLITLTQYAKNIDSTVVFPPLQLKNTLGEILSRQHLRQLRLAETEKYAHVTYFLNGGQETAFLAEERLLIQSPKVATYDLKPAMSAVELTDTLIHAIQSKHYDVIMCNYANPDMVGHTGSEAAANEAVKVIDGCLKRILACLQEVQVEALITSDHGNVEYMFDETTGQAHTAHTSALVPFIYVGRPAAFIRSYGALDDVAPTMLYLLNLEQPVEMTGQNLLKLVKAR